MGRACLGLSDKLYWRKLATERWHCYKKVEGGGFQSLCGPHFTSRSHGQECRRPSVHRRCGRCDGLEMERRGWDESGPASPGGEA